MRETTAAYALKVDTSLTFDEAVEAVKKAFQDQGFGVLTQIDVAATMKSKLNVDWPPYLILGMCNPQLAHRALTAEMDIGVMLPCNVAIYQHDERVAIVAQDPGAILDMTGDESLRPVADEARDRMERALTSVA